MLTCLLVHVSLFEYDTRTSKHRCLFFVFTHRDAHSQAGKSVHKISLFQKITSGNFANSSDRHIHHKTYLKAKFQWFTMLYGIECSFLVIIVAFW